MNVKGYNHRMYKRYPLQDLDRKKQLRRSTFFLNCFFCSLFPEYLSRKGVVCPAFNPLVLYEVDWQYYWDQGSS